jgi:hypothetical protein
LLLKFYWHGIFHGINRCTGKNDIENKGLFRLVYNRVGVTGTGWQYLALAGITTDALISLNQGLQCLMRALKVIAYIEYPVGSSRTSIN